MTAYNPNVIRQAARNLYENASFVQKVGTALGIAFGIIVAIAGAAQGLGGFFGGLIFGALIALCARWAAKAQAFLLRLAAQFALCQVEIEANTRTAVKRAPPAPNSDDLDYAA